MNKEYIVPVTGPVQAECESLIATSLAGTDSTTGDNFQYDGEVNITEYFEGSEWQ